eukprot:jgi/Orpsp1_1/1187709/evm.model.d7180000059589.1
MIYSPVSNASVSLSGQFPDPLSNQTTEQIFEPQFNLTLNHQLQQWNEFKHLLIGSPKPSMMTNELLLQFVELSIQHITILSVNHTMIQTHIEQQIENYKETLREEQEKFISEFALKFLVLKKNLDKMISFPESLPNIKKTLNRFSNVLLKNTRNIRDLKKKYVNVKEKIVEELENEIIEYFTAFDKKENENNNDVNNNNNISDNSINNNSNSNCDSNLNNSNYCFNDTNSFENNNLSNNENEYNNNIINDDNDANVNVNNTNNYNNSNDSNNNGLNNKDDSNNDLIENNNENEKGIHIENDKKNKLNIEYKKQIKNITESFSKINISNSSFITPESILLEQALKKNSKKKNAKQSTISTSIKKSNEKKLIKKINPIDKKESTVLNDSERINIKKRINRNNYDPDKKESIISENNKSKKRKNNNDDNDDDDDDDDGKEFLKIAKAEQLKQKIYEEKESIHNNKRIKRIKKPIVIIPK